MHTDHSAHLTASARVASRIIELRESHRLTREAVADAARGHGAPGNFTAAALRYIENSRPGAGGRRQRDITVDELLWLAAALEVSPLELVDDELAPLFAAPTAPQLIRECERCAKRAGGIQATVREDIDELGDLAGVEPSLAATALKLAEAIDESDGEDKRQLPALAKELRATLKALTEGRVAEDEDDDADLGSAA